jgi:hypothetical protein
VQYHHDELPGAVSLAQQIADTCAFQFLSVRPVTDGAIPVANAESAEWALALLVLSRYEFCNERYNVLIG